MRGKTRSEETRAKISSVESGEKNSMFGKKGELHPMFGKSMSQETKSKISAAKGTAVKVTDLEKNTSEIFSSIKKAAKMLNIDNSSLSLNLKNTNYFIYKNRYNIEKMFKEGNK